MAAQPTPESTLHLLHRLSQKPGVQSTLILDRATGAIVRTSGLVSRADHPSPESTLPPSSTAAPGDVASPTSPTDGIASTGAKNENRVRSTSLAAAENGGAGGGGGSGGLRSAEDVAKMVWGFFSSVGQLVDEMMGEGNDEVRLVRLRMRKYELVVVTDAKFLLVVVHDTPNA